MGAQNDRNKIVIIIDSDDDEIEISEQMPVKKQASPEKPIQKKTVVTKALVPTACSNPQRLPSTFSSPEYLPTTTSSPQRLADTIRSPKRSTLTINSLNTSSTINSLNTSSTINSPKKPITANSPQRSTTISSPKRSPAIGSPSAMSITPQKTLPPLMGKEPSVNVNRLFQRDTRVTALSKVKSKPRLQPASTLDDLIGSDDSLAKVLSDKPKTPLLDIRHTRRPSSSADPFSGSQDCSEASPSPRRNTFRTYSVFSPGSLDSPPAPSRKRPMASPQNDQISRYLREKKVFYDIEDEDGEEEDLESYINHVTSRRRLFEKEITEIERQKASSRVTNMQCPLCYLFFPKSDISEHAAECNGKKADKGIRKNTIAAAVAQNESERKKRNQSVVDTGPTNYYADSEGALALDGTGFDSEVTAGLSWESAGQIRFG